MAATKLSVNLIPGRPKFSTLQPCLSLIPRKQKVVCFANNGLKMSANLKRPSLACLCSSSGDTSSANSDEVMRPAGAVSKGVPKISEVESLLTEICEAPSIAEFELNLGVFQLRVKRQSAFGYPSVSAPLNNGPALDLASANGSVSSTSLAISKSVPSLSDAETSLDNAPDENLFTLKAPLVGYFRRCRTIKGKRAPPACKEKQQVKEGQVLCYIEQLGAEIPVESDVAGEVIEILREDGEAVGYNDKLISIRGLRG